MIGSLQICSVCHYQAASRLCKSCDKKSNTGVLYCDVCYHNKHQSERHEDAEIKIIQCCECENYTAKWMCEM